MLHFIGHGDFDADQDEGLLALVRDDGRADLVAAHRLVDLLRQARPMPRLVVLNTCSGAATGVNDLFAGTAAALVRSGVSAVAAMQYEISDRAAAAFARGFYTAIACGRGIDDALSSGRVAILGLSDRTLEWVSPVLYLRGNESHLFTLPTLAEDDNDKSIGRSPGRHRGKAEAPATADAQGFGLRGDNLPAQPDLVSSEPVRELEPEPQWAPASAKLQWGTPADDEPAMPGYPTPQYYAGTPADDEPAMPGYPTPEQAQQWAAAPMAAQLFTAIVRSVIVRRLKPDEPPDSEPN